jgi:hypothetical protein
MPVLILKRVLLAGWAVWLTVVFTTNLCDALKAIGVLDAGWMFASGNFAYIEATTLRYGTPTWLNGVMFAGVITWEGLAALLFGAAAVFRRNKVILYAAFTAGLGLWMAFAVSDEVFIAYKIEDTHWRLFIAQAVTLLLIELLPEPVTASR